MEHLASLLKEDASRDMCKLMYIYIYIFKLFIININNN